MWEVFTPDEHVCKSCYFDVYSLEKKQEISMLAKAENYRLRRTKGCEKRPEVSEQENKHGNTQKKDEYKWRVPEKEALVKQKILSLLVSITQKKLKPALWQLPSHPERQITDEKDAGHWLFERNILISRCHSLPVHLWQSIRHSKKCLKNARMFCNFTKVFIFSKAEMEE